MADTEENAGVSDNNAEPASGNAPSTDTSAAETVEAAAVTPSAAAVRRDDEDHGPALAPLVSEATGASERRDDQAAPVAEAAPAETPVEAAAATGTAESSAAEVPSDGIDVDVGEAIDVDLDPVEAAPAVVESAPAAETSPVGEPEHVAAAPAPVVEAAAAVVEAPAPVVEAPAPEIATAASSAPIDSQANDADSDSGRVAAPVFDVDDELDSGPALVNPQGEAALAALDSSPTLPPPDANEDRTVITMAPPVYDLPVAPEETQPGADLEVLGVTDVLASTDAARATASRAVTLPPPSGSSPSLARWAEQARPRRRSTLEVVRKLAARRVDVSGIQLGIIVAVAGLAGGLVSRAVAGASPKPQTTVVATTEPTAAPAAPRPVSGPIVTPLPAAEPVVAAPAAKPTAKATKAPRKRTLASAAHDGKPAAKH